MCDDRLGTYADLGISSHCLLSILFMAIMILLFLDKYPVPSVERYSTTMASHGKAGRYASDPDDRPVWCCHSHPSKKVPIISCDSTHMEAFNGTVLSRLLHCGTSCMGKTATAYADRCGCVSVQTLH